jgi:hypothetical protein
MARPRRKVYEHEVGKDLIDPQIKSEHFRGKQDLSEPDPFYFRQIGDSIKGRLIGESRTRYPYYQQKLYRIEVWSMRQDGVDLDVEPGTIREVPSYKWLQRLIKHCQLMHSIVRVVYVGRKRTSHGHCEYIFRVWKDSGALTESEDEQYEPERKKRERKPGA